MVVITVKLPDKDSAKIQFPMTVIEEYPLLLGRVALNDFLTSSRTLPFDLHCSRSGTFSWRSPVSTGRRFSPSNSRCCVRRSWSVRVMARVPLLPRAALHLLHAFIIISFLLIFF